MRELSIRFHSYLINSLGPGLNNECWGFACVSVIIFNDKVG